MSPATDKKPHRRRILAVVLAFLAALAVAALVFLNTSYPASDAALTALESDGAVTVTTQDDGDMVFAPASAASGCGIIFYPGGKVDPRAYAPLMRAFAERGFTCVPFPRRCHGGPLCRRPCG